MAMYEVEDVEKWKDIPEKVIYRWNLEGTRWILVNLKKGNMGGQHYHRGFSHVKNPETTVFISGKIEYSLKDLETGETTKVTLDSPKILKIHPGVYHELKALEESFFLEPFDDASENDKFVL
jgi:dTDP-4-dehydrorhamnose 3,5-epimerase-like enzyme